MNKDLETYLKQIEKRLQSLPADKRDDQMRELRQHLLALVAGGLERGLTENAAVEDAIVQFGKAHQVGRELWNASRRVPLSLIILELAAIYFSLYEGLHLQVLSGILVYQGHKLDKYLFVPGNDALAAKFQPVAWAFLAWDCAGAAFLMGCLFGLIASVDSWSKPQSPSGLLPRFGVLFAHIMVWNLVFNDLSAGVVYGGHSLWLLSICLYTAGGGTGLWFADRGKRKVKARDKKQPLA